MLQNNNNRRFCTFDEMVRLICSKMGDDEASKLYTKVTRFLALALEDLSLKMMPNVKSIILPIEDNFTVNLPEDFLDIVKVGVCCHNRQIKVLGRNHKLCKTSFPKPAVIECCTCDKSEDSDILDDGACCTACTFHNVDHTVGRGGFYLGGSYQYLYGYQPKNQFTTGTYDVDVENNRLILGDGCDVKIGGDLVVEYSAALSGDKFKLIPIKARTALMYKTIHLIDDKQSDLRSFKREYLEWKRSYDHYTLEDWMAAIRPGYHSAPKR